MSCLRQRRSLLQAVLCAACLAAPSGLRGAPAEAPAPTETGAAPARAAEPEPRRQEARGPGWAALAEGQRLSAGQPDEAEAKLRQALAEFEGAANTSGQRQAVHYLASLYGVQVRRARAQKDEAAIQTWRGKGAALLDRRLVQAQQAGDAGAVLVAHANYATFAAMAGDTELATTHLQAAQKLLDGTPAADARSAVWAMSGMTTALRALGRRDEAEALTEKARDVRQRADEQQRAEAQRAAEAQREITRDFTALRTDLSRSEADVRRLQEEANPPADRIAAAAASARDLEARLRALSGRVDALAPGVGAGRVETAVRQVRALAEGVRRLQEGVKALAAPAGARTPPPAFPQAGVAPAAPFPVAPAPAFPGGVPTARPLESGPPAPRAVAAPGPPAPRLPPEAAGVITPEMVALGRRLCDEGDRHLARRRYADAEACYRVVLLFQPDSARARDGVAKARAVRK